jgi:hypothetical protein
MQNGTMKHLEELPNWYKHIDLVNWMVSILPEWYQPNPHFKGTGVDTSLDKAF